MACCLPYRNECLHFCGKAHRGTAAAPRHEAAQHHSGHQGLQHPLEGLQPQRGHVGSPRHPPGNGRCRSEAICCDIQHPHRHICHSWAACTGQTDMCRCPSCRCCTLPTLFVLQTQSCCTATLQLSAAAYVCKAVNTFMLVHLPSRWHAVTLLYAS